MLKQLNYQKKLLLGTFLTLLLSCGTATLLTFFVIERNIYTMAHREMEFSAYGIHAMLQNLISVGARAYLLGRASEFDQAPGATPSPGRLPLHTLRLDPHTPQPNRRDDSCAAAIAARGYPHYADQKDPYRETGTQQSGRLCFTWTQAIGPQSLRILYLESADLAPLLDLDQLDVARAPISSEEDFFIIDRKGDKIVFSGNRKGKDNSPNDLATGKSLKQLVLEQLGRTRRQGGEDDCCGSIALTNAASRHHQYALYRHVPEFDWVLVVATDLDYAEHGLRQLRWLMAGAILLSMLLTALLLHKVLDRITRSLLELLQYVEQVDGHQVHAASFADSDDEIGRLGQAFQEMEQRLLDYTGNLEKSIAERTQALEEANRKLAAQALSDPLSGLANRRHFDQRMQEEIARAARDGPAFSLLLIDIDHFKKYNDHYGHPAGDACLQAVAEAIGGHFQRLNDLCARIGGEEFAVILPATPAAEAVRLGQALCQRVAALGKAHAQSPNGVVTISVGAATWQTGESAEDLYQRGDQALYRAKTAGRNTCQAATD